MRPLLPALFFATIALGSATDTMACREIMPRPDDLAQMAFTTATVTHAERVDAPGWNKWRVVAKTTPNVGGAAGQSTFDFTTTMSSAGCGQTPLPPEGERWVLYLDRADPTKVLDAFPLAYVKAYDARLADVR